jgi:hypothetical protein
MKTSEVLYGAADHIAVFGHHKGSGAEDSGLPLTQSAVCTLGALTVVEINNEGAPYIAARDALRTHLGGNIVAWNDAPERTAAEVIATLRAAAVIEAAKEQAAVDTPAVSVAPVRSGL